MATKRLGFQVHAPDLNAVGYALVGGRLVAGNEKPTALFMYENADKERLSLQVRKQAPGSGEAAFLYAVENGVGVFYWIDDACGYAISGNVYRAQLGGRSRMSSTASSPRPTPARRNRGRAHARTSRAWPPLGAAAPTRCQDESLLLVGAWLAR